MATVHEPMRSEPGTPFEQRLPDGKQPTRSSRVNVGEKERNISMATGAIVALQGLSRGSLPGLLSAAVGGYLIYRGAAGHCAVYQALELDTYHTQGKPVRDEVFEKGVHVEQAMLIQSTPEKLYNFWRNFENLPQFMTHLISVRRLDDRRSHWVARAPRVVGGEVEWEAEITQDEPHKQISWRSLPGSQVEQVGQIRFTPAPGDRGTEVQVFLDYVPPAGKLGHFIALLFNESPATKLRDDLRNFKRLMETGEIVTTVGQPRGTCLGTGKRQAQL